MEKNTQKEYKFYTIKEILHKIKNKEWILPVWQRDYVWKKQNIAFLFDSLYREYPVGNILLWKTKFLKDTFCEFKNEAIYKNNANMTSPSNTLNFVKNNEVEAVLDGQQRLTTLFLVLSDVGKIYEKNNKGSNENELFVHFNIISDIKKMKKNNMLFRVAPDDFEGYRVIYRNEKNNKWGIFMRLDHIMSDDYIKYFKAFHHKGWSDYDELQISKKEDKKALKNIKELRKALLNVKICFRLIENNAEEAFEIFHRLNSSGEELSPTQLSTCRLIYMNDELKKSIHMDLQKINGTDFEFDVSYIVNFLYLLSYKGKLKEKNSDNDEEIVRNYNKTIKYTKAIASILYNIGLGNKIITSYNAILPMAYYLYINNKVKVNDQERSAIKYFLLVSMIKGLFGGSSKDTINKSVSAVIKAKKLTVAKIKKMNIKRNVNNNFIVNQDIIEDWLSKYKKGDSTTKLILYTLYENYHYKKYDFHEDHMQPFSEFKEGKNIYDKQTTDTQIRWTEMKDLIPNLQLLESKDNIKKSNESLKQWLKDHPAYYNNNFFPKNIKDKKGKKVDLTDLKNFDTLFIERKKLICEKLCKIFGVNYKIH